MNHISKEQNGTVLIIIAFLLTSLIGFAGLAIDFGYKYLERTRLQAFADAAALACGLVGTCVSGSGELSENQSVFSELNLPVDLLTVNASTACPSGNGDSKCVSVTARSTWDTFFIRVFYIDSLSESAFAISTIGAKQDAQGRLPSVLAFGTSSAPVNLSGNRSLVIDGDIVSNQNNGQTLDISNQAVRIEGEIRLKQGAGTKPKELKDTAVLLEESFPNKCDSLVPPVPPPRGNACQTLSMNVCGTIPPGCYTNFNVNIDPSGCAYKMSGNYFFQNDLNLDFRVEINDATIHIDKTLNVSNYVKAGETMFYFYGSGNKTINISGNADMVLDPPSSGDYRGVSLWVGSGSLRGGISSNDANKKEIGGLIYIPSGDFGGGNGFNMSGDGSKSIEVSGIIAQGIFITADHSTGVVVNSPPPGTCGFVEDDPGSQTGGSGRLKLVQ